MLTQDEAHETHQGGSYAPLTLWKMEQDRLRAKPLLGLVQHIHDAAWAPRAPKPPEPPYWEPRPSIERSAACPSAALARLWLQLGVPSLVTAYQAHVARLADTPPAHAETLMTEAAVTHALADAERGAYDSALTRLLAPTTLQQITSTALHALWQDAVWHVVALRACRQQHRAHMRHAEAMCPGVCARVQCAAVGAGVPATPASLACAPPAPPRPALERAQTLLEAEQPYEAIEALMEALSECEAQQLYPARRMALALLAQAMVFSLPMADQGEQLLDEILPQAYADENGERSGTVLLVHGKMCIRAKRFSVARAVLSEAARRT